MIVFSFSFDRLTGLAELSLQTYSQLQLKSSNGEVKYCPNFDLLIWARFLSQSRRGRGEIAERETNWIHKAFPSALDTWPGSCQLGGEPQIRTAPEVM